VIGLSLQSLIAVSFIFHPYVLFAQILLQTGQNYFQGLVVAEPLLNLYDGFDLSSESASHSPRDQPVTSLDNLHQDVCIEPNSVSGLALEKIREVSRPIHVIKEDVLAVIAFGNPMIQSTRIMNTWFACYAHQLSRKYTQWQSLLRLLESNSSPIIQSGRFDDFWESRAA
jgi:hypothetical protein